MEFCELGDLSFFIKKRDRLVSNAATADMARKYPNPAPGGLNEVISRHFLKQLSSALEFLRARNFIHRDVKPQNLLLLPSPQFLANNPDNPLIMGPSVKSLVPAAGIASLPMLKLADFGFARSLPSTSLAETLCGSPLYMAPEILRYEKYDAKADLWSVGTVLYEMVTGKPPFRAANHVELLRKIEQGMDVIRFPKDMEISDGMKALIRALLKRGPVERISFENFFNHEVVLEEIPGLIGDDKPKEIRATTRSEESQPLARQPSIRESRRGVSERETRATESSATPASPRLPRASPVIAHEEPQQLSRQPSGSGNTRRQPDRIYSNPAPVSNTRTENQGSRRPTVHPSATAPNRYGLRDEKGPASGPVDMIRGRSQDSPSPGSSLLNEVTKRAPTRREEQNKKEERERAAQDVRDERDYVVVAKEYVEMNAFADEMAANVKLATAGHALPNSPKSNAVSRAQRASSGLNTEPDSPTNPSGLQLTHGRQRPGHRASNERVPGSPTGTSATAAISHAITKATVRLLGFQYSPQLMRGQSPPQLYSAFPSLSVSPGISGLIAEAKPSRALDDDLQAVRDIEESATRSDVVYGFAEVKYKQLIPLAPSMDHGLGGAIDPVDSSPEDLDPDAMVSVSEEALVLYVKALALLAKSMAIANAWWNKRRGDNHIPANSATAGTRINGVVQWVRARFNEVLEKAEFSRLKLIDAQKQLPEDHPAHPHNHTSTSRLAGASSTADGVVLTSGITAEKLMYDRALEMSKSAAYNEIANTDLPSCEISYVTAIRMLEAVLDRDEETPQRNFQAEDASTDDPVNGINVTDRESVQRGLQLSFYI
jgi:serine/threonine-protein kinase ULK/ATG1